MADYIFEEETVLKKDLGTWLINKMIAAGWQNVSSNPTQFAMMKTTRDSDGLECLVYLNDNFLKNNSDGWGTYLRLYLQRDYQPGSPGTNGTSSRPVHLSSGTEYDKSMFRIAQASSLPLDEPITVRYCITKEFVCIICRPSAYRGLSPELIWFGLPTTWQVERVNGAGIIFSTSAYNAYNDNPLITDTPAPTAAATYPYEVAAYGILPPKQPDASGYYALASIYLGDSNSGMRCKIPGIFALGAPNILDKDIIQVGTKRFEVAVCYSTVPGINTKVFAYQVA